jgi:predicted transcriptional regulator of viral defense system
MNPVLDLLKFKDQPIGTQVLLGILRDYSRPYDKINDLVQQGYIAQLRKGLYMISSKVSNTFPESFLIANQLYGPSYVSIDSALSYWGFIPERVFETTSVTVRLSKNFATEVGTFSFAHIPKSYYPLGIQSVALTETQHVLMASPEKSLCDKIITTSGINLRSKKQAQSYLLDDLRIDHEKLVELNVNEMSNWLSLALKANSLKTLIEAISEL